MKRKVATPFALILLAPWAAHATPADGADWAKIVKPTRAPLGGAKSRTVASETTTTSLPGAPDGHYQIAKFNTEFAAKHAAVETVVLAEEPGGWKVDGYFIKKAFDRNNAEDNHIRPFYRDRPASQ
jgi:hypothetical protein